MAAYPAPATKNRLTMPTGAPAPAPTFDMAADAYPQGTTSVAPKANALASAPMSSPFSPPKGQPRNALLASAFDGFQRGFDPAGFEKRQATNKADGAEKAKQTLALIQQQRALPAEQRAAWWKQNADTIGGIINQDVSSMPIDEAQFTDQALDGHAAALSAQLGIAPEKLSLADKARLEMENKRFDYGVTRDESADTYRDTRDGVLDTRYDETVDYTKGRDETEDEYKERVFGETVRSNRATEGIAAAAATAKAAEAGMPDFGDENGLRTQYLGQAKTFQDVKQATDRVKALSPDLNPPEQMALIFSVMKMLDPSSTVRETEYANAQNTTGAMGSMWNYYNKMKDGEFLNDAQVKQFRDLVNNQYQAAETSYGQTLDQYRGLAQRYRMDPAIIQDMRPPGAGPTRGEADAARRRNAGAILGGTGEFNPDAFRNMRLNNIPRDAVSELRADPSPEVMAEFNEAFGEGAAEAILNGNR
jgi:hypothetical protein